MTPTPLLPTAIEPPPLHVSVRSLTKTFHLHILHGKTITGFTDVSFDVPRGAFVGIAGQSGSGKSSLLKCLYRTYLADAGLQEVVVELLAERRDRGTTMIGIMHDAALLANLSTILVHMERGRVTGIDAASDRSHDVATAAAALARIPPLITDDVAMVAG